jgi:hypothetical protein
MGGLRLSKRHATWYGAGFVVLLLSFAINIFGVGPFSKTLSLKRLTVNLSTELLIAVQYRPRIFSTDLAAVRPCTSRTLPSLVCKAG